MQFYYNIPTGTPLYRVTGEQVTWPNPLLGYGAYFTKGGRYNYATEPTVYCAEDPLVALAEAAFYQALEWQQRISAHRLNPVGYPLVSHHKLWCFAIDPQPAVVDLSHPNALSFFQHTPHMLLNPSLNPSGDPSIPGQPRARDYFGTQDLARMVRGQVPPPGGTNPRPEGLKAPAIRLEPIKGYRPHQLALFVFDQAIQQPYAQRSNRGEVLQSERP